MGDTKGRQVIADLRGGRNGYLPAWAIRDTECADAVNVDWYQAMLARKRGGTVAPSTTGQPFTGKISSLIRHVPGTDETAAELWGVDDAATPVVGRLAGGTAWTTPTLKDAITGNGWDVSAASCNGKLFLAYKSAQARLHVWDGSTVRRSGLATPAAPSVANTGAGAYAAVLRYYRTRWLEIAGGVVVRRSEPSAATSFTPSGAGTAARISRPALASEGETHWEIESSADGDVFYEHFSFSRGFHIAVGTTTADDNSDVTVYATLPLAAEVGTYRVQPSYRFVAADQGRLLGFGSFDSTGKQNDVEVSAVIGSLDIGDVERVDTTTNYRLGLDENDSGDPTGLIGPMSGSFLAYKTRQTWLLTPTGSTAQPYRADALSKSVGAVTHTAIDRGEDARGNAAAYWLSHRGPYRWGLLGLEYIGEGIEDLILGPTSTINLAATKRVAWTRFFPDKRQVWFAFATGSSNDPDVLCIYDVRTGGWSRFTGSIAGARCCVLFSATLGATMSRDLKPYLGMSGTNNLLWKADTGTDDAGTTFQAYVITKAAEPGGPGFYGAVGDAVLLAKAGSTVTITDTVTRDFGLETKPATALLTAAGSETRVSVRLEDSGFAGCQFVQHQIGDGSAASNAWTLDRLIVPYERQDAVSA